MKKVVAYWIVAALALSIVILPGLVEPREVHAQTTPELNRVGPEVVTAGAPQFTIRLEGRNFESGANVLFDGVPLPFPRTTPKGKFLLAEVPASLVATPGTHTIQAVNPGGLSSATLTLTVVAKDPNITIRIPRNAVQEDSGFTFLPVIDGEGFKENVKAFVWRKGVPTTFISDSEVEVEIAEGLTSEPARIPITLRNPNGGYSNTEIFFVVPAPASIDALEPDTVEVGTQDLELKVFGFFKPDAVVLVGGQVVDIIERKQGRIDVTVPASLLTQPGQLIVRVLQDGIQSKDQILSVTPTSGPFIFAIAPNRVRVGEGRTTIDIVGANFKDAVVTVDGEEASVRSANRRRLTIVVSSELLNTPGTHTVVVKDAAGNITNTVTFEVVADVNVTTLVGGRDGFNSETCVSAEEARLRRPRRLYLAADGLLYFTDQQNHAVRTVNTTTGQVCTIAGTGVDGYKDSGNPLGDPPAFSYPNGVAVAADGTIYVSENGNHVIRRIRRTGSTVTVDTFAGTFDTIDNPDRQKKFNSTNLGLEGYKNADRLQAAFRLPDDIAIAADGTIYVADAGNHSIRRIRNGFVDTVAGNGVPGFTDGIADNAQFNTPTALAISDDGQVLYVADTFNNRVRRVDLVAGRVDTVAGSGDLGLSDGVAGEATFAQPIGLALDNGGVLYVSEVGGNSIRRIDAEGNVTTLAGAGSAKLKDGPGIDARFNQPRGLAIDRQRRLLYVADYESFAIRKIELR